MGVDFLFFSWLTWKKGCILNHQGNKTLKKKRHIKYVCQCAFTDFHQLHKVPRTVTMATLGRDFLLSTIHERIQRQEWKQEKYLDHLTVFED